MKNTFLIGIALAFVLSASIATAGPDKTPKEIKCAVMSASKVNIKDATKKKMYADYKGRRYFFCCDGCPQAFKANPAKYAKSPSIKTPKKPSN